MKYSDYFMDTLLNSGYTTCFFVAGGNSMHLLESASSRFKCVPVTHELSAAVASEYFNQCNKVGEKAFALVTAGPGMTNLVTGIAGAWLDSRELLVVGGQAKKSNLSRNTVRQLGHQEVDGVGIAKVITKSAVRIEEPWKADKIWHEISKSWQDRPGPVFLEICLDVSAQILSDLEDPSIRQTDNIKKVTFASIEHPLRELLKLSKRPLVLLGGGVNRDVARKFLVCAQILRIPVACTWTGADRVGIDYPFYAGRPNTYGMRWANIYQQQSDLLIAVGTSLGFQQTGFNVEEFLPVGNLVHVDIDSSELAKPFPKDRLGILSDSGEFLSVLVTLLEEEKIDTSDWIDFLITVRSLIPTFEDCQKSPEPFISPHEVINLVSQYLDSEDCFITASSGGTFTASMQSFSVNLNQVFLGNKGLASMGYGLAGAIGSCFARTDSRVVLFEGDGGFAQNMQELGTVAHHNLNLKIFITANDGYASIRSSQKSYFQGNYVGCDLKTGLALPNWSNIAAAYGLPCLILDSSVAYSSEFLNLFLSKGPALFIVSADPNQVYLPKLLTASNSLGQLQTKALHEMIPPLSDDIAEKVFPYLDNFDKS